MSYFMSPEDIVNKLGAFSHSELNKPPFNDIAYITQKMKAGEDLFGRKGEELIRTSDKPLPRLVTKNMHHFSHFFSSS